jgi:hypothetical protein
VKLYHVPLTLRQVLQRGIEALLEVRHGLRELEWIPGLLVRDRICPRQARLGREWLVQRLRR